MSLSHFDIRSWVFRVSDVVAMVTIIKLFLCDFISKPLVLNVLIVIDESADHALRNLFCVETLLIESLIDFEYKRLVSRVPI